MIDKLMKKIKLKHYPVLAFLLAALAMFLMLTCSQMLSGRKYVVLGGDAWEIYIANIRMLIRNLTHGETIWYSFTTSMGYNTALTVAFEMMSPFNLLFVIFAWADPNVILAIILIGKIGLSAAAFQLFASKVLNNRGIGSVVFAIFYAMCAFAVEYCIANFMWLDGLYMLPIVAWATYDAIKKNKYIFLTISFTYIFIAQFYMGYLLGIFSLIYFILLLCTQKREEGSAGIGESIGKYVLSGLMAIALSAFLWVPVLTFLRTHTVSDATQFSGIGISLFDVFNNLFWGEFQDYHTFPYIYCGIPCLLLLPFYFANKKISVREKIVSGVLFLFFLLGCLVLPVYMLLHGFDMPDMWNFRFSFILSFLLCAFACRQSGYLSRIKVKWLTLYGIGLMLFYCIEQRIQPFRVGWVARNSNNGFLINIVFMAAWAVLSGSILKFASLENTAKRDRCKLAAVVVIFILALAEVITNGCVRTFDTTWKQGLSEGNYYYTWEKEAEKNLAAIDELNKDVDPNEFYRIVILNDAIHNSDAYFGYNGITDFNSAENEALRNLMGNLGFYTSPRRTGGTGITPVTEMLLSVKDKARLYVDSAMYGEDEAAKVYENEYYLPVGYMVKEGVLEEITFSENVFENQNTLIKKMSGVDGVFVPVDEEKTEQKNNGLIYVNEDQTIYRTVPSGGEILFTVNDVDAPVFVEIEPWDYENAPSGLEWSLVTNQANKLENKVNVPFAAELADTGNGHMISVTATDSFVGMYETNGIYFYTVSEEKLKEAYEVLSKDTLKVEEYKNGYLKGTIYTSGENPVLFLGIPYTDGWTAEVNGIEQQIVPVCNGAFCGIRIPYEGYFEVELKYECPGAGRGLLITIAGLVLFAAAVLSSRKPKDI